MTHEFTLDDLADGATRDKLKWAMTDPERLRPGETRQTVTERAAATFGELAQGLRTREASEPKYRDAMKCDAWEAVVPELVLEPDR